MIPVYIAIGLVLWAALSFLCLFTLHCLSVRRDQQDETAIRYTHAYQKEQNQ